ncbi:D-inositol-3-phosphate glycosyltransferase [Gordonia sp. zg691]|uniref:D-inositol-3-phosphate glycosyltransferase n=1 Tax=Gordonia jinghuaiqii TaxID=2758710 RepID=A0A7D7LV69_9ACTN|nr:D-inositol-3-phosphate glycosyltransferase [Gordonia jinghuaiqii]MBD0861848.1 D-inositol-3-phosphate glycosyltransferase [Gordonia jinghuaiqii]MCR5977740.1 D-inositol-3-phosphate glycosyltransferase [Gordonia jinghuaiqii]QMT02401.1 D-inositol-3-phosphate glycosyltransferase [Gordonia jinghuaiqii]
MTSSPLPRRVALISVHTSPLAQPGTGDAGGLNVYVWQTAIRLARRGVEVEIFTRATSSTDAPTVAAAPGVTVRHVVAGPFEGLDKRDLPAQLCAFTAGVLRAEAAQAPGHYDVIHSHYWLSGQVGWLARDRWGVPLVHTAHTLAAVKNAALADGDTAEPQLRVIGEQQVVGEADRLVANTETEAAELLSMYDAAGERIDVVTPGADLDCYTPGSSSAARAALGLDPDETIVTFVGRIQPLKAPDLLVSAAAPLIAEAAATGRKLRVLVVGGPSGSGLQRPTALMEQVAALGISDSVTFLPPQPSDRLVQVYRASDVVAVPSHSESFGLVAIEAQACGTPVIAANVGGLGVAVADGRTGVLVNGHAVGDWTNALEKLLAQPDLLRELGQNARLHAEQFSWEHTVDQLIESYGRAMTSFAERRDADRAGAAVAPGGSTRVRRRWRRRRSRASV